MSGRLPDISKRNGLKKLPPSLTLRSPFGREPRITRFQEKLFELVDTLKQNPERGRISQKSNNIRILKVDKHNFFLDESMGEAIHIHNVLPYNMDHADDPRFKL